MIKLRKVPILAVIMDTLHIILCFSLLKNDSFLGIIKLFWLSETESFMPTARNHTEILLQESHGPHAHILAGLILKQTRLLKRQNVEIQKKTPEQMNGIALRRQLGYKPY